MPRPDRIFEPLWQARERRLRRSLTLLPWLIWAAVIAGAIGLAVWASAAHGQALDGQLIATTRAEGGAQVQLYASPCALDAVKNLPGRAVWIESNGTQIEGCFGVDPRLGLVRMYFADLTVVTLPQSYFVRVVGT